MSFAPFLSGRNFPRSHNKTSHPTDLYPNRATEPKCKLMLAKSPDSADKKIGADRSSIFRFVQLPEYLL